MAPRKTSKPKSAKGSPPGAPDCPPARAWVLYVLRCKDGTLYCGITNDLKRRHEQHNTGKGARYTKGRGPVIVVRSWPAASHSAALKAERAFKALRRLEKEAKLRSRTRKDAVSVLLKGGMPPKPGD